MASPSRTRLSREDRMEQTLDTAHSLFAERGYAAVTMDEIAAAVGVTKPLIYKISGVWGNHEGSMLLWVLILAVFGAAVNFRARLVRVASHRLSV